MSSDTIALMAFALILFGGLAILWLAMSNRRAHREMEHRERLAMIDRGLIPAPETDPHGFETATGASDIAFARAERWRTAGITIIGLGLGLLVLLTFAAGAPGAGFGIGGGFAVLGIAVLINGTQMARQDWRQFPRRPVPSAPPRPRPPVDTAP